MERRKFVLGSGLTLAALALNKFTSFASMKDFAAAKTLK
jgi:hypothetical protein